MNQSAKRYKDSKGPADNLQSDKRFYILHELPHHNPNHVKVLIHNHLLGGTATFSMTKAWLAFRMLQGGKGLDMHLEHDSFPIVTFRQIYHHNHHVTNTIMKYQPIDFQKILDCQKRTSHCSLLIRQCKSRINWWTGGQN